MVRRELSTSSVSFLLVVTKFPLLLTLFEQLPQVTFILSAYFYLIFHQLQPICSRWSKIQELPVTWEVPKVPSLSFLLRSILSKNSSSLLRKLSSILSSYLILSKGNFSNFKPQGHLEIHKFKCESLEHLSTIHHSFHFTMRIF